EHPAAQATGGRRRGCRSAPADQNDRWAGGPSSCWAVAAGMDADRPPQTRMTAGPEAQALAGPVAAGMDADRPPYARMTAGHGARALAHRPQRLDQIAARGHEPRRAVEALEQRARLAGPAEPAQGGQDRAEDVAHALRPGGAAQPGGDEDEERRPRGAAQRH